MTDIQKVVADMYRDMLEARAARLYKDFCDDLRRRLDAEREREECEVFDRLMRTGDWAAALVELRKTWKDDGEGGIPLPLRLQLATLDSLMR